MGVGEKGWRTVLGLPGKGGEGTVAFILYANPEYKNPLGMGSTGSVFPDSETEAYIARSNSVHIQ